MGLDRSYIPSYLSLRVSFSSCIFRLDANIVTQRNNVVELNGSQWTDRSRIRGNARGVPISSCEFNPTFSKLYPLFENSSVSGGGGG
jgi:hypothetical protein